MVPRVVILVIFALGKASTDSAVEPSTTPPNNDQSTTENVVTGESNNINTTTILTVETGNGTWETQRRSVLAVPISGSWQVISEHDPAGGVMRVSGDGPKPDIIADPRVDIGWDIPAPVEMITSHPNYPFLSPVSECGFPAVVDELDAEMLYVDEDVTDQTIEKNGTRKKRIVGGKVAPPQRHPWMVQLYIYNVSSGERSFHCAGTLISNSTVLTAAHCLTRLPPGSTLDVAVFGISDRRKIRFCQTQNAEENCSRSSIREIADIEVHDGYSEGNLNYDIALIYLKMPVEIDDNTRPVCLPVTSRVFEYWENLKLTGLGWGSMSKYANQGNSLSEVLKQVQLDLQPRSICDKYHIRIYGRVQEDRICTGGNTGSASCNGDSGGALVKALGVPDQDFGMVERVYQFGIVSAGGHTVDTCGFQGRPAIDTNVFYFMDWILNHIAPGVSSYRYVTTGIDQPSIWIVEEGVNAKPVVTVELTGPHGSIQLIENEKPEYKNEFSTGQAIDVSEHPNILLLPSFHECGILPNLSDEEQSTTTTTIAPPQVNTVVVITSPVNTGDDSNSVQRDKRIVGGIPLGVENYYPWMAQIYIRNVETDEIALRCSGTIISKRYILTAAHCVTEVSAPYVFDSVSLGQYNRNSTRECIDGQCFSAVVVKIDGVVIHPDYEKFTHKHNLALIRLSRDLKFSRMVQPICLPRRETLINGVKIHRYFTAGWGRVARESGENNSKMSGILLKLNIDVLPRSECDLVYSRTIGLLERSRVCGGGKAGEGECNDGGSPLMKKLQVTPDHPLHNKVYQFGIVSFADCGMQGMPTVYVNVIYYMDWILYNLNGPARGKS